MRYYFNGDQISKQQAIDKALRNAWDIDPQDVIDIFKRAHKEDEDGEDARDQFFDLCDIEII